MYTKTFFLLLIITLVSCKNSDSNEKDKIKTAHWLLGKWESKTSDGTLSENWKKLNDSTYKGQSYFIKDKDTLHFESILLQQKGEELNYIATVQGQNDDKAVTFQLTGTTEKQLVFENPKHDYPQKISYTNVSTTTLVAEISGIQKRKPSSEKYTMVKTQ
ncbi:DUF6265 family protein [Flavobacterium sp. W1B]|uniref:DUF6265 family protein n=1 Tax=Flavobacterium sp. W1B TaxID=3394146 RepID=UPI0039BD7E06